MIHGLDRQRNRAIVFADLGYLPLERGNTETALVTLSEFLNCAVGVRSVRIHDARTDIAARMPSVPDSPAAGLLRNRARRSTPWAAY
ncbi:hypothetical protein AB0D11_35700 [Streptomyces monashensis]|uniref:hypothetical protein n=1 Tax=Streptomyces monashensis TaxID=1678012 RepID=UPI0033ED4BFF